MLTLVNVAGRNISSVSSVNCDGTLCGVCIDVYMCISTHSREDFVFLIDYFLLLLLLLLLLFFNNIIINGII